jgi:hypothetical protein
VREDERVEPRVCEEKRKRKRKRREEEKGRERKRIIPSLKVCIYKIKWEI